MSTAARTLGAEAPTRAYRRLAAAFAVELALLCLIVVVFAGAVGGAGDHSVSAGSARVSPIAGARARPAPPGPQQRRASPRPGPRAVPVPSTKEKR
jgi:hypothetical protein